MLEIRLYKPGDEHGILALDRAVEEHTWNRRDLRNWYWKYQGANPAGPAIVMVACHGEQVVGTLAALPMLYWIHGQEVRGSHSIAMIILPEWQNRGLIKFIADKLFKEIENQKLVFTYGYPNDNSYALHKQFLKYKDVSMQALIERPLDPSANLKLRQFPDSLTFSPITLFDASVNALWDEAKAELKVAVIREADFLNWRYLARPDVPYYAFGAYDNQRLVGYCILKLYQEATKRRGHFVDLFTVPGKQEYGRFLIQQGLAFFQEQQCHEVNLWMQGSAFFQELLHEYGFQTVSSRPLICRFNIEPEKYQALMIPAAWLFTMGDTLEIY